MWRNWNLVNKPGAKPLDCLDGCDVVRVTRNNHALINGAHERRNGATSLTCITVAPEFFKNFESDVPRAEMDMFRVSDTEIDMAHIRITEVQDAEMICRHKSL